MRRFAATIFLTLLLSLSFSPLVAEAHVLKQDNGINAVLHVPPYDDPMTGQPTQLQFLFGTASGSFQINDYQVGVEVIKHGKTVEQVAVTPPYFGANAEGDATVHFVQPDVYSVVLHGKPTSSGVPAFTMTYLLRVTGSTPAVKAGISGSEILLIAAATLIILAMVAARQIISGKRYSRKPVTVTKQLRSKR